MRPDVITDLFLYAGDQLTGPMPDQAVAWNRGRRRRLARRAVAAGLPAVAVGAAVGLALGAGAFGGGSPAERCIADGGPSVGPVLVGDDERVLEAARTGSLLLFRVDYRDLPGERERVRQVSTADFMNRAAAFLDMREDTAARNKTVQTADVSDVRLLPDCVDGSPGVAVRLHVAFRVNERAGSHRTDSDVVAHIVRQGDRWLLDRADSAGLRPGC